MNHNKLLRTFLGDPFDWFCSKKYPSRAQVEALINKLEALRIIHPDDYYIHHCLSDSYFILGDYENALLTCPQPSINQKWYLLANRRVNLCVLSGKPTTIFDLLALFSKRVTKYGQENIDLVAQISEILLKEWESKNGSRIIEYVIANSPEIPRCGHLLYNGTTFSKPALGNLKFYEFQKCDMLDDIIADLSREAENIVREDKGLPKIGEGWISEAKLYYEIKQAFPENDVLFHGKPEWLGKQHLDVYIPELSLALEYQGIQHNQPVEYFGGVEAFQERQKLDKKKQNQCKKMQVEIIYVEEGYNIIDIKRRIVEYAKKATNSYAMLSKLPFDKN